MNFLKKPLLAALADAILINLTILATFSVRFAGNVPLRNLEAYQNTGIYITLIYLLILYLQGLYDFDEEDDSVAVLFKVVSSVTVGTIGVMALTFLSRDFAYPRTVLALSWALLSVVISMWRVSINEWMLRRLPVKNAVIFGGGEVADAIVKYLGEVKKPRFRVRRIVEKGGAGALRSLIAQKQAQSVIITETAENGSELGFELSRRHPELSVYIVPGVHQIVMGTFHHRILGDVPLVSVSHKPIAGRLLLLKRTIDFAASLLILALSSPVLLLAAAAVKLTSKGPVFYTQDRLGLNGKIFWINKFRTMIEGAEEETGPTLATSEDPRITPVGRLLRRFKIDEFPQIWNVLRGDMSMVGPRPERPEFVEEFERDIPGYAERKKVLPGITGLAQVNGKYDTDPAMKLKYDMLYIYNYRPIMDVMILYQTVQHLIRENL